MPAALPHAVVVKRHAEYLRLGTFARTAQATGISAGSLCSEFKRHKLPVRPRNGSVNLIGQRFGKLVVIGLADRHSHGKQYWDCQCDCGNSHVISTTHLMHSKTRSCGCLVSEARRNPGTETAFNIIYQGYALGAKKRQGHLFLLSREDFRALIFQNCHYCGSPPARRALPKGRRIKDGQGTFLYNGIDRLNNSKGYEPDNVVPCCTTCNLAKRAMSVEEFDTWISLVYAHRQGIVRKEESLGLL